ncbi:hypothetical protein Barb4_04594 [Bacteroidales bacterium Barb4]|nr:hypothetical protein Barb4_04594 [Bacteroidales bacterium Barb4]
MGLVTDIRAGTDQRAKFLCGDRKEKPAKQY